MPLFAIATWFETWECRREAVVINIEAGGSILTLASKVREAV
jgi:hypothetical protein